MSNLEVTAALVFGVCCLVVAFFACVLIDSLVQAARRGDEMAQIALVALGIAALGIGFSWSADILWPPS